MKITAGSKLCAKYYSTFGDKLIKIETIFPGSDID